MGKISMEISSPGKVTFSGPSLSTTPEGLAEISTQFAAQRIKSGAEAEAFRFTDANGKAWFVRLERQLFDPWHWDQSLAKGGLARKAALKAAVSTYTQRIAALPTGLPDSFVMPELVVEVLLPSGDRQFVGHALRFIYGAVTLDDWRRPGWRRANGKSLNDLTPALIQLWEMISFLHSRKILRGEWSSYNFLIASGKLYSVDNLWLDWSGFPSTMATIAHLDPELTKVVNNLLVRDGSKGYSLMSDRYGLTSVIFNCLVGCNPFDGTIVDPTISDLSLAQRVQQRISAFDNRVQTHKAFTPKQNLCLGIRKHFYHTFEMGGREQFPRNYLLLPWQRCATCGKEFQKESRFSNCPCSGGSVSKTLLAEIQDNFSPRTLKQPGRIKSLQNINTAFARTK